MILQPDQTTERDCILVFYTHEQGWIRKFYITSVLYTSAADSSPLFVRASCEEELTNNVRNKVGED